LQGRPFSCYLRREKRVIEEEEGEEQKQAPGLLEGPEAGREGEQLPQEPLPRQQKHQQSGQAEESLPAQLKLRILQIPCMVNTSQFEGRKVATVSANETVHLVHKHRHEICVVSLTKTVSK
jgi:hypothetical protein